MPPAARMVLLTTVGGGFHAKVVAARLGVEGIPVQLRGGVDGLYPIFSEVQVLVPAAQLETARQILLADAVDAVFDELGSRERAAAGAGIPESELLEPAPAARSALRRSRATRRLLAVIAVAVAAMLVAVGYLAAMHPR